MPESPKDITSRMKMPQVGLKFFFIVSLLIRDSMELIADINLLEKFSLIDGTKDFFDQGKKTSKFLVINIQAPRAEIESKLSSS